MYNFLTDENVSPLELEQRSNTIQSLHLIQNKFKETTNLISIYKNRLKRGPRNNNKPLLNSLPKLGNKNNIKQKSLHSFSDSTQFITKDNNSFTRKDREEVILKPKENIQKEKLRLNHIKEQMKEIRYKKAIESKQLKEENRLIKENVWLLKEKLKEENNQRKKLGDTRKLIEKTSQLTYKKLKVDYAKSLIGIEIDRNSSRLAKKEKELKFLKMQFIQK
jgi:hypothetical protein